MSSELARLRHSVNITVGEKTVNTWDDWHIVPTKRPIVSLPTVKTSYVDIPGSNGRLDYTEVLAGEPLYNDREGSWEFVVLNGYQEWFILLETIKNFLHGKEATVVLDDSPEYQYKGRLSFESYEPGEHNSNVTIKYTFSPYKSYASGTSADWRWDDLTLSTDDYTIYYGTFDVNGEKPRNIYNPNNDSVPLALTCTSVMNVLYHNDIYTFSISGELTHINGIAISSMEYYEAVEATIEEYREVTDAEEDHYDEVTPVEGDNPKLDGWYELVDENYILTEDEEVDPEKTYYEFVRGDDPVAEGWYEQLFGGFMLTLDTSVVSGKTYYIFIKGDNPKANGWYEIINSMYVLSEDITAVDGKTYYRLVQKPGFIDHIELAPGDNFATFIGNGRVTLSYNKGVMI